MPIRIPDRRPAKKSAGFVGTGGAQEVAQYLYGLGQPAAARGSRASIFIGDSPNDVPMFQFFPQSVGVANILRFEEKKGNLEQ